MAILVLDPFTMTSKGLHKLPQTTKRQPCLAAQPTPQSCACTSDHDTGLPGWEAVAEHPDNQTDLHPHSTICSTPNMAAHTETSWLGGSRARLQRHLLWRCYTASSEQGEEVGQDWTRAMKKTSTTALSCSSPQWGRNTEHQSHPRSTLLVSLNFFFMFYMNNIDLLIKITELSIEKVSNWIQTIQMLKTVVSWNIQKYFCTLTLFWPRRSRTEIGNWSGHSTHNACRIQMPPCALCLGHWSLDIRSGSYFRWPSLGGLVWFCNSPSFSET